MMSAADPITQERVYQALKAEFLAGAFPIGVRLDLQEMADRHRASKTPVREAACRLTGEGLFEPNPDGGFRVPLPGPRRLIQLYAWNQHLLLSLVHVAKESTLREILDRFADAGFGTKPVELATFTSALFLAFAFATGNPEVVGTLRGLNERLHYPRIAEATLLKDIEKELRTLTNSAVSDVQKNIRRRLESYHERRIGLQEEALAQTVSL